MDIMSKRPYDLENLQMHKICKSVITDEVCLSGSRCQDNHYVKGIIDTRKDNIKQVEEGCPHLNLRSSCANVIYCRVGSCIDITEDVNKTKVTSKHTRKIMNSLSKDIQIRLRKKKYVFLSSFHIDKSRMGKHKLNNKGVKHHSNRDEILKVYGIKNNICEENTNRSKETYLSTNTPKGELSKIDCSPIPTKSKKLIDFRKKIYVAPLTTVGNLPFRRILKRYGADITCSEMVIARNLLEGKSHELALLKRHPDEDIFGVQLAAGYSDLFTRASEVLQRDCTMDFVDLNLGCPIGVICNHGAGSKLMLRENKLKDILFGMSQILTCPITIKMRTGWDENKSFAHKLVPKIQSWGIDGISAIMVHGRSRLQRYTKLADWDYIQQVAKSQNPHLPCIPVIGNGDIFSYVDYEEKISREGLESTAMLARGALIKPWLPTEIKERRHWDISASERLDILKEFAKFGLEHWGSDQHGVNITRRFMLEWLRFLCQYIPVGILEAVPQSIYQHFPLKLSGRSDIETLMLSKNTSDWIKISEMILGPIPKKKLFPA